MKYSPMTVAVLIFVASSAAKAASVVVDWLKLQPGGTPAALSLLDDGGDAAVGGALTVTQGMAFPGLPKARGFAAGQWLSQPGVLDSMTGGADLSVMEFRVVPAAGAVSYRLDFRVPSNQPLIIVVGGLLGNGVPAVGSVFLEAMSDSAISPVVMRSGNAWSNGLIILDQGVDWNPLTQALGIKAGANGDSEFAFFDIAPITGDDPRVSIAIPDGYATGAGDSIFIGIGIVVPEPAVMGLLALGVGICAGRRHRPA
jgi:hypothetical protein